MLKAFSRYDEFIRAFCEANSHLAKAEQFSKGQKLWNELKKDHQKIQAEILRLKSVTSKKRSRSIASFMTFLESAPKVPKRQVQETPAEKIVAAPEIMLISEGMQNNKWVRNFSVWDRDFLEGVVDLTN